VSLSRLSAMTRPPFLSLPTWQSFAKFAFLHFDFIITLMGKVALGLRKPG